MTRIGSTGAPAAATSLVPTSRRPDPKVGIPREVKNNEYRVAITPSGVHELVVHGHEVFVEKDAGVGSSITDEDYVAAGRHDPRRPPTTSGAPAT